MSSEDRTDKKKWKKVAQIVAGYLVAAWTFLQFLDWTLIRYQISPYWVDVLLWIFVGILPSLILYVLRADTISRKNLKLREKIIFPANVLLLGILIYFIFGNSDLGSTTKEVSFTNEFGDTQTQIITKEEFRIGFPIFNFQQKTNDSTTAWIGTTINKLIALDLNQDKNFAPEWNHLDNTVEKVKVSSIFNDYYVDGEYEVKEGVYSIVSVLRNSKNGKEIKQIQVSGTDFFSLIDQITVFLKESLVLRDELRDRYVDLDIKEITTTSMKALEAWSNSEYEQAVEEDQGFALAYFYNAQRRTRFSQGELEEKYLIDKAFKYKDKLPYQLQFEILMYKHLVYNRWKDAEELLKYQLEIEPNNRNYNQLLYIIYSETKNIDAYYEHASARFNKDQNITTSEEYFRALVLKGKFKESKRLVKMFELIAPDVEEVQRIKAYNYLANGEIDKSEETYKKVNLRWPEESVFKSVVKDYIAYHRNNGSFEFDEPTQLGIYRSSMSEQQIEYFDIENTKFIHYKNQLMNRAMVAENKSLIFLDPTSTYGSKHEFEKDSLGQVYRVKVDQFTNQNLSTYYYYKELDEMREAFKLLQENKRAGLKETFEKLVAEHPKHWFLKGVVQHLTYIEGKKPEALQKQFSKIAGNYENRVFWVENGQLFYKRDNLTRVELLPISETRYINLSKYSTNYGFEFLKDNQVASFAWTFDFSKNEWSKLTDDRNYLLKN